MHGRFLRVWVVAWLLSLAVVAACAGPVTAPAPVEPAAAVPTTVAPTAAALPATAAPEPTASPRPTRTPTPPPSSQIAYVGRDEQLYLVNPDGTGRRLLSPADPIRVPGSAAPLRQTFAWPTWSPDGARIAYIRLNVDDESDVSSGEVYVAERAGRNAIRLYATEAGGPIYLAWSPDGSALAMLVQEGDRLRLLLSDARGGEPDEIVDGNPIYLAWSPDSQQLLLHVGGDGRRGDARLALARPPRLGGTTHHLTATPNAFRAPAWLADGQRGVWSAAAAEADLILVGRPEAEAQSERLAAASVAPAFVVSPAHDEIAFSEPVRPGRPIYRGISLVSPGAPPRRLVEQDVVAFLWSPDGEWLAFVSQDEAGESLAWYVVPRAGGDPRLLHRFVPTRATTQYLLYFDQYAQSMSLWSPDSRQLVLASRERSEGSSPTARLFIVPIDGGPPVELGEGTLGVWSPWLR